MELPLTLFSLCSASLSKSWKFYLQNVANPAGPGPSHQHCLDGQTILRTASWSPPASASWGSAQNLVMASCGTQCESRSTHHDLQDSSLSVPGTSVLSCPITPCSQITELQPHGLLKLSPTHQAPTYPPRALLADPSPRLFFPRMVHMTISCLQGSFQMPPHQRAVPAPPK